MITLLVAVVALIVVGSAIIDPSGAAGGKQGDAASMLMSARR